MGTTLSGFMGTTLSLIDYASALALGAFSGLALTLMDRIDEHGIIERHKTPYAYLAALIAAASVAWTLQLFPVLYSLPFCVCLEWILKNKIDFPSHVFSLFLMAMYFGWRIDLFWQFAPYIALFLALRLVSGTLLRRRVAGRPSSFFDWYYSSYWEKLVCNVAFAIALRSVLVMVYCAGVAFACLYTKRLLPGKLPSQA